MPWIESPLVGAEGAESDELVFHQRHEANTLELFFDLFFVANLATFTAYHTITDVNALLSYICFFAVLWSTWFQITLHDVRFARDCKFERMCKFGQMMTFVAFALVGSKFRVPTGMSEDMESKDNKVRDFWRTAFDAAVFRSQSLADQRPLQNFRILCYTLVVSRVQLTLQYAVVLCFTSFKGGYERLVLPLCLNTAIYATSSIIFGAMSVAFLVGAEVSAGIVSLWWVVMFFEGMTTIVISSFWRMLSFKATHLVERMGLLTLIVIGEGAIGITKTVSKLMGKSEEIEFVAVGQVISIMLILIFLWALYFDNQPQGHYGTIKQQIWSLLHFPFHLAIVGVAEGCQQIAQTRMIIYNVAKFNRALGEYCVDEHLDGAKLGEKLNKTMAYYQFDNKLETKAMYDGGIAQQISLFTSPLHQGICSEANTTMTLTGDTTVGMIPQVFNDLRFDIWTALFSSMGIKLDPKKLANSQPGAVAWGSFETVYIYWWGSLAIILVCYIAFLHMIRRHKADISDYFGVATRGFLVLVCMCALAATRNKAFLHTTLGSAYLLPLAALILALINFSDKLIRQLANKRILSKDRPLSAFPRADHHGKPHYDKLHHDHDPEKDPEIKGSQLKRRPALEVLELDHIDSLITRPDTGYTSDISSSGSKPVKLREMV